MRLSIQILTPYQVKPESYFEKMFLYSLIVTSLEKNDFTLILFNRKKAMANYYETQHDS